MANEVAFTAYPTATRTYDAGFTVLFDGIITNIGGFYDSDTSVFTCPYTGVYLFNVVLLSENGQYMDASITKEGSILAYAYADNNNADQGSTTVVTECQAFDSVRIECYGNNNQLALGQRSSFTGVLLSAYS